MKRILDRYFSFTHSEFNGLLALIFLIAAVMALPVLYKIFKPAEVLSGAENAAFRKLSYTENLSDAALPSNPAGRSYKAGQVAGMFAFDPNTLNRSGWEQLGLSPGQAQAIINYRNKGGKFFKPEDLQKMYTIKSELYQRMLPYIRIANVPPARKNKVSDNEKVYKKPIFSIVEINTADSAGLETIKGIGAVFAKRIVAYRARLGGFYKTEQLMEVYGLDSTKFKEIKDQISIEPNAVKQININTATFEDLKAHPYLRFKQINAIIQYRKIHGNFSDIGSLKKVVVLDNETIQELTPYLIF